MNQVADLIFQALNIPSWAYSLVVVLTLLGVPVARPFDDVRKGMGVKDDAAFQAVNDPTDVTVWHADTLRRGGLRPVVCRVGVAARGLG